MLFGPGAAAAAASAASTGAAAAAAAASGMITLHLPLLTCPAVLRPHPVLRQRDKIISPPVAGFVRRLSTREGQVIHD